MLAKADLEMIRLAAEQQVGFTARRTKLAEVVKTVLDLRKQPANPLGFLHSFDAQA